MTLFFKTFEKDNTQTYLFYPGENNRTPFKRRSITVLMDNCTESNVRALMSAWDIETLSMEYQLIFCFPVPPQGGWAAAPYETCKQIFDTCQIGMGKPDDKPLPRNAFGIPTTEAMLATWHPMNDTKYVVGIGDGATFALTLAVRTPANIAGVLAEGGHPSLTDASESAMPVCLVHGDPETEAYFRRVNGEHTVCQTAGFTVYAGARNPLEKTMVPLHKNRIDAGLLRSVCETLFLPARRPNTSPSGDIEPSMCLSTTGFEYFIHDFRLGDGKKHTWFTYVPRRAAKPDTGWPLVMFYHGGSDNPAEAAEMSKLHELGEQEGFITVYPWGTDCCGWNSAMDPAQENDADFCNRLIDYMLEHYPVDRERVYVTGFSNGAAMAQTVALLHPEKIAGLFHIDSNWPGKYGGYQAVTEKDITPFRLGFERKQAYDYLMPVWYTYGSREISFPVFRDSTQQNQYDLWKRYNHIPVTPTPARGDENPTGCGAEGETIEVIRPTDRHPEHWYQVNRFYTADAAHLNLYNFVIMHDKGHDIAQMDAALGWQFIRKFRRKADGSLEICQE
ncbi:MAG: alpha/beta hydrolase [Clostridia bacterium]|nr:alpha/beta hydrolase [Clostridia bacterium]